MKRNLEGVDRLGWLIDHEVRINAIQKNMTASTVIMYSSRSPMCFRLDH